MVTGFAEIVVPNSWIWKESVTGQKAAVRMAVYWKDQSLWSHAPHQPVVGM